MLAGTANSTADHGSGARDHVNPAACVGRLLFDDGFCSFAEAGVGSRQEVLLSTQSDGMIHFLAHSANAGKPLFIYRYSAG
eukprot:COSAG02_NODE_4370_length_5442_cov_338.841475_5_plen_81_part_00